MTSAVVRTYRRCRLPASSPRAIKRGRDGSLTLQSLELRLLAAFIDSALGGHGVLASAILREEMRLAGGLSPAQYLPASVSPEVRRAFGEPKALGAPDTVGALVGWVDEGGGWRVGLAELTEMEERALTLWLVEAELSASEEREFRWQWIAASLQSRRSRQFGVSVESAYQAVRRASGKLRSLLGAPATPDVRPMTPTVL